jgi:hypothetical protein
MSPTLFDHVSHTIFEAKTHNPSSVVIDKHSIDSKQYNGNQQMSMIHPHIVSSQIKKPIPLSQDNEKKVLIT